jgi:acetolactate synthase-1/2/3 large subunit
LLQTGYNFDGFARAAKKIMVDIDEKELRKINVRPDIPVCSDANDFIGEMIRQKDNIISKNRKGWILYCDKVKKTFPLFSKREINPNEKVNTYLLIDVITEHMGSDDIYIAGSSGSCIEVSMQAFKIKQGQRMFTTKGLASMGYGIPSTIGAALAAEKRRVVCVVGDGGFQMNIQELETIRRLNLPIKIFVLNNSGYAAIRGTQTNLFNGRLVACTNDSGLSMPDIIEVSRAYKLRAVEIKQNDEVSEKIIEVLNGKDPVICNVITPIDLKILPKQVSYKRKDGQMESLPLEYLNPPLEEGEFKKYMIVPLYVMK